ncbi:DUF551 domain-containing protein [Escherichia coli]|nr:DUF551 domain-containing protein [Escherichia coli]
MSTITKERVAEFIKKPLDNGLTRGEQMELARIALASLEAEAVAYMQIDGDDVEYNGHNEFSGGGKGVPLYTATPAPAPVNAEPVAWLWSHRKHPSEVTLVRPEDDELAEGAHWSGWSCQALYAAPPATVSVPAAMEIDDDFDSSFEHGKAVGWNACRAAMLQAEPVSNRDELPLDYLQGHKDGLEWAAQLAEANHPQTGDWLYDDPIDLARAIRKGPDMPTVQAGNSPVTPDGWISCSERMPEIRQTVIGWNGYAVRQCVYTRNEYAKTQKGREPRFETLTGIWHGVTHWMPLPEPPQEVNRG